MDPEDSLLHLHDPYLKSDKSVLNLTTTSRILIHVMIIYIHLYTYVNIITTNSESNNQMCDGVSSNESVLRWNNLPAVLNTRMLCRM